MGETGCGFHEGRRRVNLGRLLSELGDCKERFIVIKKMKTQRRASVGPTFRKEKSLPSCDHVALLSSPGAAPPHAHADCAFPQRPESWYRALRRGPGVRGWPYAGRVSHPHPGAGGAPAVRASGLWLQDGLACLLPSFPGAPPAQPAGHQVNSVPPRRPVWLDLVASRAGAPAAASGPGPVLSSVLGGGDLRDC